MADRVATATQPMPAGVGAGHAGGFHKVPNPFPLTLAGMLAALGPQAINFGISIGGGEAYLLPNVAARGTLHMHWLMTVSVVLETALVYECIKYSICTGRSFFAATADLAPRNFWPWFWAIAAILTWAWPAWMGGAVIAAERFTGISTPKALQAWGLPASYIWSVIALLAVLVIFYFSDRTYGFMSKFFTVIMFANIFLVLVITLIAAKPQHYWQVLMGYLGVTFLLEGYPTAARGHPRAGALQPAGREPHVGELLGHRGGLRDGPLCRPRHRRAPAARGDHRRGDPLEHERSGGAPQDGPVGQARRLQPDPLVGDHRRRHHDLSLLGRRARVSPRGLPEDRQGPERRHGPDPDGHHRPGRHGARWPAG